MKALRLLYHFDLEVNECSSVQNALTIFASRTITLGVLAHYVWAKPCFLRPIMRFHRGVFGTAGLTLCLSNHQSVGENWRLAYAGFCMAR